jgi:hypothetical protein
MKAFMLWLCIVLLSSTSYAQTRQECEMHLRPQTTVAGKAFVGGTVGTVVGLGAGALACSAFLAAAFFDLGLSYSACVMAVAAVGTAGGAAIGTSVAEDNLIKQHEQCATLAEKQ